MHTEFLPERTRILDAVNKYGANFVAIKKETGLSKHQIIAKLSVYGQYDLLLKVEKEFHREESKRNLQTRYLEPPGLTWDQIE